MASTWSILFIIVVFALLNSSSVLATHNIRCRHNEVISNLLQTDNVTARFQMSGNFPPFRIVEQRGLLYIWCTPDEDGNHINMTFSQPIVMEGFTTNGATSTSFGVTYEHYVSNFSILYSESMDGPLHRYPSDFIATSSALMVGFVDAIAALKLQFRINEFVASGSSNDYCWRMRIIGCVQDDGIISEAPVLPSSTTTFSTSSSSNSSHTATSSVCSAATTTVIVLPSRGSSVAVPPSCGVENGAPVSRPSSGAAGLLGGGAAVLVLGVVLIVIAVILCVVGLVIIKRKNSVCVEERRRSSTIAQVDNVALYSVSDPQDEGMLPNALYESNETTTTGNSQAEYAAIDYEQTVHTAPNMSYRACDQKNKTENLYTTADEVTGCYETPDPNSANYEYVPPSTH